MPPATQRTAVTVGLFFLLGAALLAWLMVRFSRDDTAFGDGYPLTVEVRDATGIRAGVPVRLGGVGIGRVSADPVPGADFTHLVVELEIFEGNRIPVGSLVKVGTSGLLGDSFVRIIPPELPNGDFLPEGHRLLAEPAGSLTDLAENAEEALEEMSVSAGEIRAAARRVDGLFARIDKELLTEENLSNLGSILAEFRASSENLKTASERLGPLLDETGSTLREVGAAAEAANSSFALVDKSTEELNATLGAMRPTVEEFDGTLDDLRKTLVTLDEILKEFEQGDGLAAAFLKDGTLKRDLESFLDKLERNGILLYPREGGLIRPPSPGDEGSEAGEERRPFPGLKRQP